jgi:3-hydroxybutyryl-CoA dehydrogenase
VIRTVGVAGAGTMGSGIAQAFVQAGYAVCLYDAADGAVERARRAIERGLTKFVEKGTLTAAAREAALGRLRDGHSVDVFAEVDYVVEAIVEDEAAKRALFQSLDRIARPDVILASNTSSISITALGGTTSRPDRVVGMHFMNPVPLIPLVELIRGQATSAATIGMAAEVARGLGKTPVESADRPGFIANRILMPMINEAVLALQQGVGSAEAIDTVMKLGMNHPMGPLALADLIGLDVCLAIMEVMERGLGDKKYAPAPLLREKVAAKQLGRKTRRGFYEYKD